MKTFKDKVSVVTGAASGIGRGLAERCAQEGMKVVLADVEEEALNRTAEELEAKGASVLSVVTDVSKQSDVERLAEKAISAFSEVHLLCNNAGVGAGTSIWESTIADWEWVIGVNLWGVIYGVRTFVPIMLKQGTECHIVNTASMAGLISGAGNGIYAVTKHGMISLTETLYHELKQMGARINASVLCPGYVDTNILESGRNRPAKLQNREPMAEPEPGTPEYDYAEAFRQLVKGGMSPQGIADCVFDAIKEEKFYILANPGYLKQLADLRADNIIHERNPVDPFATG
ncbi:MAG: SDR family NAD(P)-dependent oxidoreductase [Proteobacteria bacterium]|nr:SDR family NAD(P)-dependent oxidoreductase [Pseudomonadota bacterium]